MHAESMRQVREGYVMPGWQPQSWSERLRYLARRCRDLHPQRAAHLDQWADNVDLRHPPPEPNDGYPLPDFERPEPPRYVRY